MTSGSSRQWEETLPSYVNTESDRQPKVERRHYLQKLVSSYGHKKKQEKGSPIKIEEEPETPCARVEPVLREIDTAQRFQERQ